MTSLPGFQLQHAPPSSACSDIRALWQSAGCYPGCGAVPWTWAVARGEGLCSFPAFRLSASKLLAKPAGEARRRPGEAASTPLAPSWSSRRPSIRARAWGSVLWIVDEASKARQGRYENATKQTVDARTGPGHFPERPCMHRDDSTTAASQGMGRAMGRPADHSVDPIKQSQAPCAREHRGHREHAPGTDSTAVDVKMRQGLHHSHVSQ